MTKRRRNKPARLFRLKPFFEAVPLVWEHVLQDAASEDEAIQRLIGLMTKHGRRPRREEVIAFVHKAPQRGLLAMLTAVVAIHHWFRDTPLAGLGVMIGLAAAPGADLDPGRTVAPRLHIFRYVVALLEGLPDAEFASARRMFQGLLATSLAPDDDPVRAAEGRRLLQEHMAEMREVVAAADVNGDDLHMLRGELAKSIANVGQSLQDWAGRPDCDDPRARLEDALQLHNEAMSFPERVADPEEPVSLFHSLRMRGTCQRSLARFEEDDERRLELLAGSVADAAAACEVAKRHPGRCPDDEWVTLNLVNARANLLRERLKLDRIDKQSAKGELGALRQLAETVRPGEHRRAAPLVPQMHAGLDRLSSLLGGERHEADPQEVITAVMAALSTLGESRASGIDANAAIGVAQDLESLPEGVALPGPAMGMLGGMLGHVDIEVIGANLASRLMAQEVRLLSAESGTAREGWDPVQHVEDGFTGYAVQLCNWSWSHAERRIAAGWTRLLASVRLTWAQTGMRPVGVLEELRLADLMGSTAWRSDLHFYGGGPVRSGPIQDEATWRCLLYRTRWERDHVVDYLHGRELRERMSALTGMPLGPDLGLEFSHGGKIFPHGTPEDEIIERTGVPRERWQLTPDGIVVPKDMTPERARIDSVKLLDELRQVWSIGITSGWAPEEVPDAPAPEVNDLVDWLARNGDAAILCVGAGLTPSVVWANADGVVQERVEANEESASSVLHEYLQARDEHSYGVAGEGGIEPGLPLEELERRYAAKVATPQAAAALNDQLERLADVFDEAFGPALSKAKNAGIRRLVVLTRSWARHIPWHLLSVDGAPIGEVFSMAWVESLARVPQAPMRIGGSALYVGGRAGPGSALGMGKAVLKPLSDRTAGPLNRDDFEEVVAGSSVLRLFAHGTTIVLQSDASGIELDEDDQRPINRFSVSEARTLDLRGARRVELWACESGRGDAHYPNLLHYDEPTGMDAAVLLAGAEVVISSLWVQYTLSTAMIAEAFVVELAARPQPEAEALGGALRRYKAAMDPAGTFSLAVESFIRERGNPVDVQTALRAGLDAWRTDLWRSLLGQAPPTVATDLELAGTRLGPSSAEPAPATTVNELLRPFRAPLAWAGWKVTLRSKEVFGPGEAGDS